MREDTRAWIAVVVLGLIGVPPSVLAEAPTTSQTATRAASQPSRSQPSTSQTASLLTDTFAHYIPADVQAFAEIRDLARLAKEYLPGPGLLDWTTLAAGQTSRPAVTVEWGQRVSRILGMSLEQATQQLFGEHVAVAAPSFSELSEGIVLARAPNDAVVTQLLKANEAKPCKPVGGLPCHRLKEGLALCVKDRIVLLGALNRAPRLFERSAALLGGGQGKTLTGTPGFAEQVGLLPPGGPGVVYLDTPTAGRPASKPVVPASRPAPTTTTNAALSASPWIQDLRRLAVGLYERQGGFDLEVRGLLHQAVARNDLKDVSIAPVGKLPKSTLAVYAQTIDWVRRYRRIMADRSKQQRALRFNIEVVRALLQPLDLEKDFLAKLGPQVMLVLGHRPSDETQGNPVYDMPMAAVMIESSDAAATADVLRRFAERFLGWMNIQFTRAKRSLELSIAESTHHGVKLHYVALESLFKNNTDCPYLDTLELSWAAVDGWLVLSTHPEHIRQIVDARRANDTAKTFASTASFRATRGRDGISTLILVRPARLASMLQSWIDYCAKNAPHVFKPLWWKRMMIRRAGRRVALGIIIEEGAEPGCIVVGNPVLPDMPAAGRLRPGDKICAVDGRPLSKENAEDDLRDFVAMREGSSVVLRVERTGKTLDVRIPMSPPPPLPITADIDPVGSIQHLIRLFRNATAGGYVRSHDEADRFNGSLLLRLNHPKPKK